jgi:DNA-binding transcriptional ArsR family regulator
MTVKIDSRESINVIQKESRFKIVLCLIASSELSLGELSKLIGKSKSTISRDMQELIKHDLVLETRVDKKTRSKYYTINRDFLFQTLSKLSSPQYSESLSAVELKENFNLILDMITYSFFILNNTLPLVNQYIELFKKAREGITIENNEVITEWLKDMNVHLRFTPLSQKGFEVHEKHYKEFAIKVNKDLYEVEKDQSFSGEYLTWNIVLPIKRILEWTNRG